jgi:hypothetical protein
MAAMTNFNSPGIDEDEDRRKFLISCGGFAAVTASALILLLSTSLTSTAIAREHEHHHKGGSVHGAPGPIVGAGLPLVGVA